MVLPDGTRGVGNRPKLPKRLLIGGIIVVTALVVFGLGRLTTLPDTEAVEDTSTTTTSVPLQTPTTQIDRATWTVSKIATEQQLVWSEPTTLQTWSLGIFNLNETLFLYGVPNPPFGAGPPRGLNLWTSSNGVNWEERGMVVPRDTTIYQVIGSGTRLFAAGVSDQGSPILMSSHNGYDWNPVETPSFGAEERSVGFRHVSDDTLIVSTTPGINDQYVVQSALPEKWQDAEVSWSVEGSSDGPKITLNGPFGIAVAQYTAEELGLSRDDLAAFLGPLDLPEETTLWIRRDDTWRASTIEAESIETVHQLPDGRLLATGDDSGLSTIWVSDDGNTWVKEPVLSSLIGPNSYSHRWNDGFIASSHQSSNPDLSFTTDFGTWEPMSVSELLPSVFSLYHYPL